MEFIHEILQQGFSYFSNVLWTRRTALAFFVLFCFLRYLPLARVCVKVITSEPSRLITETLQVVFPYLDKCVTNEIHRFHCFMF